MFGLTQLWAKGEGSSLKRRLKSGVIGAGLVGAVLGLSACSVEKIPLGLKDHASRLSEDEQALFADQEPITGAITLEEAMARTLKYHQDQRLKLMEEALSRHLIKESELSLLPSITATVGYTGRDNKLGSNSYSLTNNTETVESSTSSDRDLIDSDVTMVWNVLDFGLSYVRAQQQADRSKIAEERRRKVAHNLIQQVREAYWKAYSAQQLLPKIDALIIEVEAQLKSSAEAQANQDNIPMEELEFRRGLLEDLVDLKESRRELVRDQVTLATMMNLRPGHRYTLEPDGAEAIVPDTNFKDIDVNYLERLALIHRPELHEEDYQARISANDVRRAYLKILPGFELSVGQNWDSNSYAWEQSWISWGTTITKNLFDIYRVPVEIDRAEAQVKVVQARRLALSMAVISQVHLSLVNLRGYQFQYKTADEFYQINKNIVKLREEGLIAGTSSERELITAKVDALRAEFARNMSFKDVRQAVGNVYVTIGADPMPKSVPDHSVATLAQELKRTNAAWMAGKVDLPDVTDLAINGIPADQPLPEPDLKLIADAIRVEEPETIERVSEVLTCEKAEGCLSQVAK